MISRESISDYTGLTNGAISTTTSELRDFGWLDKNQTGEKMPNRYKVKLPDIPVEDSRFIKNRRLPDSEYQKIHAETFAARAAYRAAKREEHAAEWVAKHEHLIDRAASEFEQKSTTKSERKPISEAIPTRDFKIAPANRNKIPLPQVKPRSVVVAALRAYLQTNERDPSIADADLEFHVLRWGENPDEPNSKPLSVLDVPNDEEDSSAEFFSVDSGVGEYEVPVDAM
ncbi:hypothetical protein [Burkholderia pseudomallei]|uniref:hypothetical protein n=1 Tax=Burkholderia pseudomallei TaxID=28450 RepID=UPI001300B4FF|nr:hypothetical protein [Burkholderia pseudomallei]QGT03297.1 hypothetical protein D286_02175 [Burkholderia pseudomallei]